MPVTIAFGVVGVTGFMLFGLYLSDRSRLAFLFFAVHCWALAMRRMLEQLEASLYPISAAQYQLLDGLLLTLFPTLVLFGYALARKPVPWFYRIAIGLLVTLALEEAGRSFLPASMSLRLSPAGNFDRTHHQSLVGTSLSVALHCVLAVAADFRLHALCRGSLDGLERCQRDLTSLFS